MGCIDSQSRLFWISQWVSLSVLIFWKYLLFASVVTKLYWWNELSVGGCVEAVAVGILVLLLFVWPENRWVRLALLMLIISFLIWNLWTLWAGYENSQNCGCFGKTEVSITIIIFLELVGIPLLVPGFITCKSTMSSKIDTRAVSVGTVFAVFITSTLLMSGSTGRLEFAEKKTRPSAKELVEKQLVPNLKLLKSGHWIVIFASSKCEKCNWIVDLLSLRISREWNILVIDLSRNRSEENWSLSPNRNVFLLNEPTEFSASIELPVACVVKHGTVIDGHVSSIANLWQSTVHEVNCALDLD